MSERCGHPNHGKTGHVCAPFLAAPPAVPTAGRAAQNSGETPVPTEPDAPTEPAPNFGTEIRKYLDRHGSIPPPPVPRDTEARDAGRRHCGPNCSACWQDAHKGHDVGQRHEDGRLFSATCHDCNTTYQRTPAAPVAPIGDPDEKPPIFESGKHGAQYEAIIMATTDDPEQRRTLLAALADPTTQPPGDEVAASIRAYQRENIVQASAGVPIGPVVGKIFIPVPTDTEARSEAVAQQVRCDDHHWVSTHQPGFPVYWIRQCSICGLYDADSMRAEIAASSPALDVPDALITEVQAVAIERNARIGANDVSELLGRVAAALRAVPVAPIGDDMVERAARAMEVHQVAWIDHEVGWSCGCDERGDLEPLLTLNDANVHIARAALRAALGAPSGEGMTGV